MLHVSTQTAPSAAPRRGAPRRQTVRTPNAYRGPGIPPARSEDMEEGDEDAEGFKTGELVVQGKIRMEESFRYGKEYL